MKRVVVIVLTVFAGWIVLTGQLTPSGQPAAGETPPASSPAPTRPASPTAPVPAPPPPAATVPVPSNAERMTVVSVHDGDTLDLRDRTGSVETVRVIGIDTPEIYPVYECYGDEATDALRELAPVGGTLWVATDEEPFDHYDRMLLYLWTDDGEFINLSLVERGFAEPIRVRPNDRHWNVLRDAGRDAERAGLGMWSC